MSRGVTWTDEETEILNVHCFWISSSSPWGLPCCRKCPRYLPPTRGERRSPVENEATQRPRPSCKMCNVNGATQVDRVRSEHGPLQVGRNVNAVIVSGVSSIGRRWRTGEKFQSNHSNYTWDTSQLAGKGALDFILRGRLAPC